MVALLRYRRIPYAVSWAVPSEFCDANGIEKPNPIFEPTFLFNENGKIEARCDSTPLIRRLEEEYAGRSVLPPDPVLAFIDYLIEDFADEWCTKYMFHYRWAHQADAQNAAQLIPLGLNVTLAQDTLEARKEWVVTRQVGRLHVVGSNETTTPTIDASFRRFLIAMERRLSDQPFMLGSRPGAGDFALYGQLNQLVGYDPTSRAIAHDVSPRTVAWVDLMRDQGGLEPSDEDWIDLDDQSENLRSLLGEIGRVYAPAQLANAHAVQAGEQDWEAKIDGATWAQRSFPYQAKCLRWTNEKYAALNDGDRDRVDAAIQGSGIKAMLFPKRGALVTA
ncbi:MAG: glutathione S-transferase [Geminicoccus sp.]|nr:glutathione S-transferase [Geminicoccus sp.]